MQKKLGYLFPLQIEITLSHLSVYWQAGSLSLKVIGTVSVIQFLSDPNNPRTFEVG